MHCQCRENAFGALTPVAGLAYVLGIETRELQMTNFEFAHFVYTQAINAGATKAEAYAKAIAAIKAKEA